MQELGKQNTIHIWGPASLSNLGPGFDSVGMCISGYGDMLEAFMCDEPGMVIEKITGDGGVLSLNPANNTVAVAAQSVLDQAGAKVGISFRIHKGIPMGSGIGGSSASAVAGAYAANALLGYPFEKTALLDAVLEGETIASGGRHGDNVLPALLGGLVLVSASDPTQYRKLNLPCELHLAIVVPEVQVLTKAAREMLKPQVAFKDAIQNSSDFGFLVAAFHAGDWEAVGQLIMQDRLVEPLRATLVPCYQHIKEAALHEAGALGCALTGSGPAMFAVCTSETHAAVCAEVMIEASRKTGVNAIGKAVICDEAGARTMMQPENASWAETAMQLG
ncbi:MAG TPA: homoserine kinase [Bacteroidetes bacterium]|nr:homoserine kinase [Bacteroidota bacterium]HRR09868.1 homoserine kinase [Rhodothermales bacterium]